VVPAGNPTLHAIWTANPATVSFDLNGGNGSLAPIVSTTDAHIDLPGADAATRNGYTFTGWAQDGTLVKSPYTVPSGGATLVAQWKANPATISYNANGGTGTISDTTGVTDGKTTVANAAVMRREGYRFIEWNTAADGTGTSYAPGADITFAPGTTILYAIWAQNPAWENTTTTASAPVTIPNSGGELLPGLTPVVEGPATATLGNDGTITVTPKDAKPGDTITVKVTDANNTVIDTVTIEIVWEPAFADTEEVEAAIKELGDTTIPEITVYQGDIAKLHFTDLKANTQARIYTYSQANYVGTDTADIEGVIDFDLDTTSLVIGVHYAVATSNVVTDAPSSFIKITVLERTTPPSEEPTTPSAGDNSGASDGSDQADVDTTNDGKMKKVKKSKKLAFSGADIGALGVGSVLLFGAGSVLIRRKKA
ncbi:InlB B-repeat-containing protein, partial [Arcanobacterium haemolyticum]|nr:InlB B-repeat-containing protein [Arcanobacterium haemolyticum]